MNKFLIICILLNIFILSHSSQKWLKEVNGYNDYAGIYGKAISSLRVSGGEEYRVHTLGGKWLPAVKGNDENDAMNGYAGIDSQPIDGVAIKGATYKVHILGGTWLPEVSQYNIDDEVYGMAGIIGRKIDAIMIKDRIYAVAYIENPTPSSYSRDGAIAYAREHVHNINHECGNYQSCTPASYWGDEHCGYSSENGGDCANFVSQCLVLGGNHDPLNGTPSCRGFPCGWEEVGAKRLGDCLEEKGWISTCDYLLEPPSYIKEGDVLIYHSESCSSFGAHAVIVTEAGSNVKITCHSNEQLDVSYKYMGTSKPYYQWLHYQGE